MGLELIYEIFVISKCVRTCVCVCVCTYVSIYGRFNCGFTIGNGVG